MLKICLSNNIQKSKFYDLTQALGEEVDRWHKNEEILKFVPSRLLNLLDDDKNQGNQLIFTVHLQKFAEILSLSILINVMLIKGKTYTS